MKAIHISLVIGFFIAACGTLARAQSTADSPKPVAKPPQFATADELWNHIQDLNRKQNADGDGDAMIKSLIALDSANADFVKRFPKDPRHAQAEMHHAFDVATLAGAGVPGFSIEDDEVLWEAVVADSPPHSLFKDQAILFLADMQVMLGHLDPLEQEIADLRASSPPKDINIDGLELLYASKLSADNPQKAGVMMQKLTASANAQTATDARAALKINGMLRKPLDLKFVAVDGRNVDLGRLRGKVVIINFWATWCGPCCAEIPNLNAVYSKYHDKGFEIIGVSLDEDKEALVKFTKENGIKWPQYFDGKGMKNEISLPYGINSIPRMWLVDKKGNLVNVDARGTLEADVKKLLPN